MLITKSRTMSSNSTILEKAMDGQLYPFNVNCVLKEYSKVPGEPYYNITISSDSDTSISEGFKAVRDAKCGT